MARKKMTLQEQIATIKNYLQVLTLRIDKLEAKQNERSNYIEDIAKYLDLVYDKECKAIQEAMNKSKILNPNGKYKKITTKEQIENNIPQEIRDKYSFYKEEKEG